MSRVGSLGTAVNMTVLRKLRTLGYLTSYSHGGRFYTLGERVRFDEQGMYRVNDRCFSRFGSLRICNRRLPAERRTAQNPR